MKLIYMAVLFGAMLQWLCVKHKGLAHGWPLADHRRPTQSTLNVNVPLSSGNGQRAAEKIATPKITPPILPRDTSGRDIGSQNFDFPHSISPDQQGAFLLTSNKMFPDRDGPEDRQVPDSFFKKMQSESSAPLAKFEHDAGINSNPEVHGAPYFAVLPNPEQQPDNMQDYALLDETDDPKVTTAMSPIIALPPIPLNENRITKIPIMTANIKDVIFPSLSTPKSTTATVKRQQVSTQRPKIALIRSSTPQKASSRADQSSAKPNKHKGMTARPTTQTITGKFSVRSRPATDVLKEHRGQKRSPQQELSYIPAFRRRQTISNPFNNAPNRNFANSGDASFGNAPPVRSSHYAPVNRVQATNRNTFQSIPYDNAVGTGGYNLQFGLNNNSPNVLYGSNPLLSYAPPTLGYGSPTLGYGSPTLGYDTPTLGYGSPTLGYDTPTLGYNDKVSGNNVPFVGYNNGFSVASPPWQNTFGPYGGGSQIPTFIGGSLGVGFPNIALSYPISTLGTPIFPSYLSGFATAGPFQQPPLQHQTLMPAPYYNPVPAVNPLFSSPGYPLGNAVFDTVSYKPREHHRNNTESYRSVESYEIDSLNGFNRPPRRKNAKPVLRPTIDGFMGGMPDRAPIGQSISRQRPPAIALPPVPYYPTILANPSIPFGMPHHLTALIPRRPSGKNGFPGRLPPHQTGLFYTPEDYFDTDYDDFDFPDQIKKPDFDDDDDFVLQQKHKATDFVGGVNKQPEKSNPGISTFKMQSDKTGSVQGIAGSDSFVIDDDDDALLFTTTPPSVNKVTEEPITVAIDVRGTEGKPIDAQESLQQEIPQNKTDNKTSTEQQEWGGNERENGTTPMPQVTAQDRFSTDDSPYETLYYHGDPPSHNPSLIAYFYPRRTSSINTAPQLPSNYQAISINDPEIWKYFKVNKETSAGAGPVLKEKQTRQSKSSLVQECIDLFGNKANCKPTKSKRKSKYKTKQKQVPELPYEVLQGGLFLNFGEGSPQQYSDGTQLFYNGPQTFPFNELQQQNIKVPQLQPFIELPQQNFVGPQLPNAHAPIPLNLAPHYPLPPPNTVPLSHIEHTLLSQSSQGGWRPIAGPPRQVRRSRPTYNRQYFQVLPPPVSPHGHPALQKGIRFPQ